MAVVAGIWNDCHCEVNLCKTWQWWLGSGMTATVKSTYVRHGSGGWDLEWLPLWSQLMWDMAGIWNDCHCEVNLCKTWQWWLGSGMTATVKSTYVKAISINNNGFTLQSAGPYRACVVLSVGPYRVYMVLSVGPYRVCMVLSVGPYRVCMVLSVGPYRVCMVLSVGSYRVCMVLSVGPYRVYMVLSVSPYRVCMVLSVGPYRVYMVQSVGPYRVCVVQSVGPYRVCMVLSVGPYRVCVVLSVGPYRVYMVLSVGPYRVCMVLSVGMCGAISGSIQGIYGAISGSIQGMCGDRGEFWPGPCFSIKTSSQRDSYYKDKMVGHERDWYSINFCLQFCFYGMVLVGHQQVHCWPQRFPLCFPWTGLSIQHGWQDSPRSHGTLSVYDTNSNVWQ